VVVIEPEIGLNLPDFKASEQTFIRLFKASELLANQPSSKLMVITSMPDQPSIKYSAQADYPGFYREELEYRQLLKYPPFSLLVSLTLSGHNLRRVAGASRQLGEELSERFPALEIIGPKVKPRLWKKVQKEVKLYLRLAESKEFFALSQFLEDFSHKTQPGPVFLIESSFENWSSDWNSNLSLVSGPYKLGKSRKRIWTDAT